MSNTARFASKIIDEKNQRIEELEKENANKDLLLKQKTERINELEKENKFLKDTNFMVENFHKVCKELEEIKEKNSFKYVNKLSENNRQLEKENAELKEKLLQSEEENSQYRIRIAQLTLKLMDKEQEK